jgi:hypothetical protein
MRLNGLLAEDPYWRHRIARDIYYVLLDTELAMIDEFESTVNRQLAGVDKPLMWSLRVAQGHVILQPLVKKHFVDPFKKDEEPETRRGKERLFNHWWSHDEFGVFTAPKVKPLTQGAGQCPAVSYFLTWHNLLKVEDVFARLINELVGRRSVGGEDPLAELNFCIVAGLAGGTGRGAWQLIAFKVRELLTAKYGIPAPVAYLFDSGVFENIYRRHPRQEVPMKVNSLTGVSELSVWMENLKTAGRPVFEYQLPSMDKPADEQMDVLNIDLNLDTSAAAPVDNAVLIFGGNQLAVLANNMQYHEMVGTGLYAALSRSSIESQRINERPAYQSLGTATFEVNAVTLRGYFEGLSRIQALRMLAAHNNAAVEAAVDGFISACHLRINITRTNRREFTDDEKGTVMQRACHHLLELYSEDLGALGGALETDEPDEVEVVIQQLLQPSEDRVDRAVQRAVDGLETAPEEAAKKHVGDLFRDTRSVANVRRFVEEVVSDLEEELDELPAPERMKIARENDPSELVKEYKAREYLGWAGPHFNEDERVDLEEQTRRAVLYANYGALCAELRRRYKSWISIIRHWQDSAEQIMVTADKLMAKFKNDLKDDIEAAGNTYDDFFDALFCDFDAPEQSIPEEFAKSRFYRRDLKPPLKRRGDLELLGELEFKKELNDVVSQALLNTGLNRDAYDELDKLRRDLESAIRRTVYLPFAFIEQNFSIRNVVANLRQAWLHRFHEMLGQADQLEGLINKFSTFFGMRPTRDGDTFTLPMGEEFILEMGASLAGTCRPYWRIRKDSKTDIARVSLFLPIAEERFDREAAERFIHQRLHRAEVTVEVYTDKQHSDEGSKSNPFIMMAYSIEGVHDVEQISSLDYWQTPTVKSLLMKCEGQGGVSIFDQTADHNGVSFTDPLFITHVEVKGVRWKPWIDKDASAGMQADETCDALIYALMDPPESLAPKLHEKGWTLPLIGEKKMKWYEFSRRAMFWQNGSPKEDTGCPWKARSSIGQGIRQVYDVLAGAGRQDGSLVAEGPKWADRIRQESRVFWDEVLLHLMAPKGSEPYQQLLTRLEHKLDSEAQKCADDDPDRKVWTDLLTRINERRQSGDL